MKKTLTLLAACAAMTVIGTMAYAETAPASTNAATTAAEPPYIVGADCASTGPAIMACLHSRIETAKEELAASKAKLNTAKATLKAAEKELAAAKAKLNTAKATLKAAEKKTGEQQQSK